MKRLAILSLSLSILLTATGCFGVSSETRALRDAALENSSNRAEEKFELGLGMFTFGAAKMALKYIDIPAEARTALTSVHGAEVSIYDLTEPCSRLGSVLTAADRAMEKRDCDRLVGVIHENQLVAVYVPHKMSSTQNAKVSVLVLNDRQMVCASARGNVQDLLEIGLEKARAKFPKEFSASSKF